ncbi:hypothetical protein FKW77_002267 [Venturia effusa]|uniref:RING-type domain-containing protein n=1 Tax=Venturia effusa TaxID=50376 RepID=A0A517LDC1_9PEZI|nr:hypothetical protein FKW77_002267 [Venturia effusa]
MPPQTMQEAPKEAAASPQPEQYCEICAEPEALTGPLRKICRSCTTQYCQTCIRELFLRAIKSSTCMPARCCEMIPIHVGAKCLSKEEAAEYRTKFEEWKTDAKDRVYCPTLACSEFIPLKQFRAAGKLPKETEAKEKRDSKDPVAPSFEQTQPSIDCPKCSTVICIKCKSFAHPTEPCQPDTSNDEVLALLSKWGYKRCPRCGYGTRRMFGCSHMQCICGAHWCWGCERNFNECERTGGCPYDEDEDDDAEYDDYISDEEIDMADTIFPTPETDKLEDSLPDAPAEPEEPSDIVMGPLTEREARRRERAENLDARGGRYWERQGMDFGSEPAEAEHSVWGCEHDWAVRDETINNEDEVQCHECWNAIPSKAEKNNVEVKPNSSELSYLLYYASTRRSKLQKVGDFLDKRTTSDVWKGRIGNVQVTLQILKALIEKTPRDLPLYASALLRIFRTILQSNDVTMIEETVPAFETFCAYQDPANLSADQDFLRQYERIICMYASCASKDTPIQAKTAKTVPVLIRFRKAGLEAIKAIARTEILNSETSKQLSIIIPAILENIYSENGQYLTMLERREEEKVEVEKEIALRRRQSISTVRTVETTEGDPAAASGTTEAADRMAEQEAAVIALEALKKVFSMAPRGQLRLTTAEVLKFMAKRINPKVHFPATETVTLISGSWPCTLWSFICSWAPVQDRYVILVTAMETLIHSPIVEEDLERQYVLATLIGWLLSSSDINFIGLSVMDVLVGLIQHVLGLLQLGGNWYQSIPHQTPVDGGEVRASIDVSQRGPTSPRAAAAAEVVQTPSAMRRQLLEQLQRCIGGLAVHVYYSDQISDMVSAILSRLRQPGFPTTSSTASAIENPAAAADGVASSINLSEKPNVDGFFSFDTARVSALQSIKEIISWANWTKPDGSIGSTVRSPIPIDVWEGTQWLLRDPNWAGRVAYVDALILWMKLELKKHDLSVPEEEPKRRKGDKKENGGKDTLARRAVSNASQRDISPKRKRNTFLQLLHLAIYENAHQYAESEADIDLLHLLLTTLIQRLGVNAVQHGLPMIFRLQEDISSIESPLAKINIASLVHGYMWALSVNFSFDAASTGRDVMNEISRRVNHNLWLQTIKMPPLSINQIVEEKARERDRFISQDTIQNEAIKPFDKRIALVNKICEGYSASLYSPPTSRPQSPNRQFSQPILATVGRTGSMTAPKANPKLPPSVRDELLADWTKESVIAATSGKSEGSRSASLQGSSSPTNGTTSKHLTVGMNGPLNHGEGALSPRRSHVQTHHGPRDSRPNSAAYGLISGSAMREALSISPMAHSKSVRSRRASVSASPTPYSTTSSVRSAVKVDDLKRVLSGGPMPFAPPSQGEEDGEESGSDSMVSYEGSDISYAPYANNNAALPVGTVVSPVVERAEEDALEEAGVRDHDDTTVGSLTPRPMTAISKRLSVESARAARKTSMSSSDRDSIPPVPPLPEGLRPSFSSMMSQPTASPPGAHSDHGGVARNSFPRSGPQSLNSGLMRNDQRPRTAVPTSNNELRNSRAISGTAGGWNWNARELLDNIDAESPGNGSLGVAGKGLSFLGGRPPY